jgi:hypothetical protein
MHDHFSEFYEWDENGIPRRKKRVARDREHIHFPVTVMDAMQARANFHSTFADGSVDHTSPHRKGFRFADTSDADRLAANDAYEARREQVHYANRRRVQRDGNEPPPMSTPTLDALRIRADAEYEARSKRMAKAWRQRDGA